MTDRVNALIVVLDRDIRIDDVQAQIDAIKMVKGVLSVSPNVSNLEDHIAHERAHREISSAIYDTLSNLRDKPRK